MKKIKSAAVVAGGLAAAILGLSSPAQAGPQGVAHASGTRVGIDHLDWLDDIRPKVNVPNVDTNIKHREIVLPIGPG
jgi:hypothetical protein